MSTDLIVKTDITQALTTWTDADQKLIRQMVAKNADDSEFKMLLYQAWRYNLDPLLKEIWCYKFGDKPAIITIGINGFIKIAHRDPQCDGFFAEGVYDRNGKLIAGRATAYRKDMNHPFVVTAPLTEFNGKGGNWNSMPETMIKKVALAQVLRQAFNISLYEEAEIESNETATVRQRTTTEGVDTAANNSHTQRTQNSATKPVHSSMSLIPPKQAATVPITEEAPAPAEIIQTTTGATNQLLSDNQLQAIYTIGKVSAGLDEAGVKAKCWELYRVTVDKLTRRDAARFIDILRGASGQPQQPAATTTVEVVEPGDEESAKPLPADAIYICETDGCGQVLKPMRSGRSTFSVEELVDRRVNTYGKILCDDCARKAKSALQATQNEGETSAA